MKRKFKKIELKQKIVKLSIFTIGFPKGLTFVFNKTSRANCLYQKKKISLNIYLKKYGQVFRWHHRRFRKYLFCTIWNEGLLKLNNRKLECK
jgi:hypothetical protein